MNLIIAAGLFDSPWAVAAFVIAGAIINWLSKRRAENAAQNQAPESEAPDAAPPRAPNWEERLRRMVEAQTQPPPPAAPPAQLPPVIRRAPLPRATLPPVLTPVERPNLPAVEMLADAEVEFSAPPVRRYELSDAAHAAQAKLVSHRLLHAKTKRPILGSLRNPHTARQAFAASLVLGPPKGLEL